MRFKIRHFIEKLLHAVRQALVEFVVSVFYWIILWLDIAKVIEIHQFGWTFPICFCMIYTLNLWTRQRAFRWAYFASIIIVPLFWWWQPEPMNPSYVVALIISQFMVFLSRGFLADESFVRNALSYIGDAVFAMLIATLTWILAQAIFFSITYIFEIWQSFEHRFIDYSSIVAFVFICPLLFITFNISKNVKETNILFGNLVVNYIITPALLIYTGILYLYFVKILFLWTLPKGGLSYMGISFIAVMLIGKSVQPLLQKRAFNWFYAHYSWWTLPALIMLWISIIYRVTEYSLTEARIYLVITAIITTLSSVFFFFRHQRNYTLLTIISIALLAFFTYIPGISANDLGVNSQIKRFKAAEKRLTALSPEDTLRVVEGRTMYHSIDYIYDAKRVHWNYDESSQFIQKELGFAKPQSMLDSLFSPEIQNKIKRNRYYNNIIFCNFDEIDSLNIQGYSMLCKVYYNANHTLHDEFLRDSGLLRIYQNDSILAEFNVLELFNRQMPQGASITQEIVNRNASRFMIFDAGEIRVVLRSLQYDLDTRKIDHVDINFILIK